MDVELLNEIRKEISIPIIFSGGIGNLDHILEVVPYADALTIASYHYNKLQVSELKKMLLENEIKVRS